MATQSADPPSNPSDQNPVNSEPKNENADVNKQTSPTAVFVNSEPMREDQIQNAMKFLSHPKVSGSPIIHRRSFLEKKGLTKEEIDEAFRRVPDPPPSAQTTTVTTDGKVISASSIQPQASTQVLQTAPSGPSGVASSPGALKQYRFHWSHAIYAVGILAISGAGTVIIFKKSIIHRFKSWVRKVVLEEDDDPIKKIDAKPSLAEEAAAAAKAAAAAATDVAKASQEMLISKSEERRQFEEFLKLQLQEMKSLTNVMQRLEAQTNGHSRSSAIIDQDYNRVTVAGSKQPYINGKLDSDRGSVRSTSPPASVEPSVAPHPKSYMEIMAMIQRGEKPANIREINDLPPDPNQQPSNPRLAPRTKPWEGAQNNSSPYLQPQGSLESYNNSMIQESGPAHQSNSDTSVPWWQRKNVRVTEIENEVEINPRPYSGTTTSEPRPPIQRTWVPPQPPPVVMAEAAEAIRRPKSSRTSIEKLGSDQTAKRQQDITDELVGATKYSESGGAVEVVDRNLRINSGEIREEVESF